MKLGESRDFAINARKYRDTLIAPDVHQISNPATGTVYGEIVQIPAEGRNKAYWLAGPGREKTDTWNEAVLSVRAQFHEHAPVEVHVGEMPALVPIVPVTTPPPPAPDTTGWLTSTEAAKAYKMARSVLLGRAKQGLVPAVKVPGPTGPRYLIAPPPEPYVLYSNPTLYGGRNKGVQPDPPAPKKLPHAAKPKPVPTPVAAADVPSDPEPKITIRPAATKLQELEARIAALESPRRSWLSRLLWGN